MTAPPEESPAQGRRVPEFFIVGHHKSGTTALYEMLRAHPQIYMPSVKEPRFFDSDLHALGATGRPQLTLDTYLGLFDGAAPGQLLGEASPSYLRSRVAASAIADMVPAARCIAILREPASFVRSLHSQLVQEHVETELDLARAFENEERERGGQIVHRYSDHIHYVEQLRRFDEAFPREQMLVLIYDDFRSDNDATVRRVLRFLGVDENAPIRAREANPSVALRSPRLDRLVRRAYGPSGAGGRALRNAVRTLAPERLRSGALPALRRRLVYREQEPFDPALEARLRERFSGEVTRSASTSIATWRASGATRPPRGRDERRQAGAGRGSAGRGRRPLAEARVRGSRPRHAARRRARAGGRELLDALDHARGVRSARERRRAHRVPRAVGARARGRAPDAILVHYSVFAYALKGLPFQVPRMFATLRGTGVPVVGVLHEIVYPWFYGGWRGAVWAVTQRAVMLPVMRVLDAVIVTAEQREQWLRTRRWLPARPVVTAPVF